MIRLACLRMLSGLIVGVSGLLLANPAAAAFCGPGPHWIDTCAAGVDVTHVLQQTEISGGAIIIETDGSASISRSAPLDDSLNFPGSAPVDGHFDVIDIEIVALSLTNTPFNDITVTAGPGLTPGGVLLAPSLGAIVERPGDPGVADVFIDLFFETDIGGTFVYNHDPLRMEGVLLEVPSSPGSQLVFDLSFSGPITLHFDPVVENPFADITAVTQTTLPEPELGLLLGIGLATLGLRRWKAGAA